MEEFKTKQAQEGFMFTLLKEFSNNDLIEFATPFFKEHVMSKHNLLVPRVKLLRELTNMGLKQSKIIVDAWMKDEEHFKIINVSTKHHFHLQKYGFNSEYIDSLYLEMLSTHNIYQKQILSVSCLPECKVKVFYKK